MISKPFQKGSSLILTLIVFICLINTANASIPANNLLTEPWNNYYGKKGGYTIDADSTHDYDVLSYYLKLYPYYTNTTMSGEVTITFTPMIDNLSVVFLHAVSLNIQLIRMATDTLTFHYVYGGINVDLPEPYQPGDTLSLIIDYIAPVLPDYSAMGYHRYGDYGFTFSEPYGARKWFPCYDLPFDKAQSNCEMWLPVGYTGVSNGELMEINHQTGYDVYYWQEDDPVTTYLTFITCGPYSEITAVSSDSIPLHYYVYPEDSANAVYDFANTPDMVDYYCDTFGAYPFEMYGMAEAQIFNGWGAMEHQTVTTYGYNLIDGFGTYEWIVAHELSHMWWGDCLSPLTFADIWLNEGFATYSEALCMDFFYNNLQENMANKAQSYFWEDQYARYAIYNPPPAYLFGSAVYDKGAWVQHMLRYIIGDSAFFAGLQNYFLHHQYGNVITAEYQAENEEVSGMDLDWYFDEWVYQAGYPEYEYSWTVEMVGSNFLATVYLEQVQNNAPIFTMPIEFLFSYAEEETLITVWNDQQNQAFQFTLNFIPYDFGFDPNEKILKSSTQVSVSEIPIGSPYSFALDGNYPNPFNASTEIKFSIDHPGKVTLSIYNSMGQKLAVLVNENLAAGEYSRVWEANNISSGIYWMVLSNKQKTEIKKMILLK